ncbi:MAG: hypothetical protein NT030_08370, partial [Candidatus Saganbacteria bacterium]|nr:hypothetical protein [Candidatus Saganbacteria bacterium]
EEDGIGVKTPFLDRILGKEGFTGKVKDIGLSFLRLPASPDLKAQDIVDDATIIALKEVLFAGEVELIRKGIITSGNPRYKYLLNAAIDRDFIERFVKMFPGLLYHPLFMVIFGSYAEKFKIESDEGNPKKVKDPCAFLLEVAQKMDVPWESLHLNANDLLHREEFVAKALIQAALNFYRPGMRSAPKGIGGKLNSELKAITSFADLLIYDKLHYPLARVIKGTLLKEKYVDWANTDDSLTVHNVSLLDDKIDRAILKKCAQLFLKYLEFYKSDEEKANLIRTFERMGYSFKSEGLEERWKEITHWADVLEKAANDKSFKEFELTYNDYEGWNDDIVNALKVFARIVAPEFSAQSEGEEPTLDIGFTLRNYVGFKEGTEIEFRSEKEIVRGIASQDNAPLVTSVPVKEDATKTPVEAAGEDFFSQYVLFKFLMAPQIQIQMQWGLSVQVSNMLYAGQKGDPFAANDIYDSVTMWLETRASFLAFSYNPGAWLRGISDLWNQGNKYGAAANALIMVPFGMGAGMALLNVAAANYARATNRVLFRSGGNTTITGAVKKSFVENELAPLEGEKPGITAWYKAARGAAKTYRFLPWLKDNALLNPFLAIKKGGRKTVVPLAKIVGEKVNEKVPVGGLITKAETKVLKNRKYQTNRSDFEKSGEPASKLKIDPLNPQGEYTFLLENSKSGRFTARVFESPLKAFNYVIGKGLRTFVVSHILGLFQVRPLQYERFGSKSITISAPDLLRIVSGEIDEVFKALGLKLTAQEKQVLVEEIGKLWRANGGDKKTSRDRSSQIDKDSN